MTRKTQMAEMIQIARRSAAQATTDFGERGAMTSWKRLRAMIGRMKKLNSKRIRLPSVKGKFLCRRSSSLVLVNVR